MQAIDPQAAPANPAESTAPAPAPAPHSSLPSKQQPSTQAANGHEHGRDEQNDERELPVVLQDLVPLSYLIDRVVSSAYSDLATLVETLPSSDGRGGAAATDDQARKRKIVDHVLNTRRQLVKLLVLARWSQEAGRLHKAINIVGFLAIQNHQIDQAIETMRETHDMLARARVRNYDLETAINVLSSSSSSSALPSSLTDPFASDLAQPLSDTQVLETLSDLNRVLLARLVLRLESLPPALADPSRWRIHDGRVTFRVEGMWEADLTYGGGNEPDEEGQEGREWYLLAVKFLFRVKDARGAWSSTPLGPIKEHILQLCNQELLRRPYFPAPHPPRPVFTSDSLDSKATTNQLSATSTAPLLPDPQAPPPAPGEAPILYPKGDSSAAAATSSLKSEEEKAREEWDTKEREWKKEREEVVRKRKRDRPLDRGYTFLQRLALSYQLEAVHSAAVRLAATSWNGSLEVERRTASVSGVEGEAQREGEDEVRVHYWRPAPTSSSAPNATKPARPTPTPTPSSANATSGGAQSSSTAAAAGGGPPQGRRPGPGGTIVFSLRPVVGAAQPVGPAPSTSTATMSGSRTVTTASPRARREKARQDALQAALDQAAAAAATTSADTGESEASPTSAAPAPSPSSSPSLDVRKSLCVTWLPSSSSSTAPSSVANGSSSPPSSVPAALASLDLTPLLGSDLDVARVLKYVTALHARDAIERLAGVVLAAAGDANKQPQQVPAERAKLVYPPLSSSAPSSSSARQQQRGGASNARRDSEDGAVAVPYLHLPLVGAHAIGAHIDPTTGRFELRAAPAVAPEIDMTEPGEGGVDGTMDGGSSARDQRLRLASERIDRERFAPAISAASKAGKQLQQGDPDAWMKGVVEVVARIRASTILDELDILLSLLSLPLSSSPVRRLPLPPRELAKLGPNTSAAAGRAAFLFVPLLADEPALAGWFLLFELFEDGVRAALLYTAERSDQLGNWTEILEVGWLGSAVSTSSGAEAGETKSGEAVDAQTKGANLGFEIKSEVLRSLWWHCVRRAAAFSLELQLHLRRIPYRREAVASAATAARLVLPATSLLRAPDVEQLLRPDAELRCAIEEDGRRKSILLVYLRISPGAPSPLPPPSGLPPSVLYNPAKGALVLLAEGSLADTVERLLRALATVLRLVRAAKPHGSPSKAASSSLRLKSAVKAEKR
ncbi:hypothetical protein JCM10908_007227 [Rhodotorula pacifica]|uniref:mediator of RNA polymerase II transcription subunit 14 n=1 Tax=Rhodotorula pacifica TaxID=1495444 RepID=UPI0031751A43